MTWKPGDHRDLSDDPAVRVGYVAATSAARKAEQIKADLYAVIVTVVMADGRAVTTCEPELPKSSVAEVLRQTTEAIIESDPTSKEEA